MRTVIHSDSLGVKVGLLQETLAIVFFLGATGVRLVQGEFKKKSGIFIVTAYNNNPKTLEDLDEKKLNAKNSSKYSTF